MAFAIITDSASNLDQELIAKYKIDDMVTFHYQMKDKLYPCFDPTKDYEVEGKKYYDAIREGEFVKTSLISPQEYIDCFEKHLKNGKDIIYVSISSKVSGTYNSARNAWDMIKDKYPERKVAFVDSLNASFGEAVLAIYASKLRDEGKEFDDIVKTILDIRMNIRSEFTVDKLIYLRRTGRISALTFSIGSFLDIKPLLHGSRNGEIESYAKVRGRKKALMSIVQSIQKNILHPEKQIVYIAHCDVREEAQKVAELIKQSVPVQDVCVKMYDTCTGSHVGPGTIAFFYYGKEKEK